VSLALAAPAVAQAAPSATANPALLLAGAPHELPLTAGGGVRSRTSTPGISLTRSATKPYWACPTEACEAIIDPQPLRVSGRYELPQGERPGTPGPLLEGGGEKGGLDPQDLQSAYKIPTSGGETHTIALVEAFGYEAAEADLNKYRERYGLGPCTTANGCFRKVNQAGEEEPHLNEREEWTVESALDMEMASAACPHCHILLVEANDGYVEDLAEAVNTAAKLGATEISNSYGIPEQYCIREPEPEVIERTNCEEFSADYDHPGVLVTASSGDNGYENEKLELEFHSATFPAASPYVAAVGGTVLRKASNARGWSEEAWFRGGSGCSRSEPKTSWQTDGACAHRTESDVAAVAACATPVSVYNTYYGWVNVCGTSVSSPLVAGIEAHASEYARSLPGAAAFYLDPGALFDVTAGINGECVPPREDEYLCRAEVGYDGPTGNGTPDGSLQLESGPPSATTKAASAVTSTAATLNGTVDPNGVEATYRFEYGTGTSYGTSVPVPDASAGSGKLPVAVGRPIAGLKPGATYHFRLVATNVKGVAHSEDGAFTTAPPVVEGVQPSSGPTVGGTTVTITGANLAGATAVRFGPIQASSFSVQANGSISAVSQPGTGVVDVTVTTGAGTSATGAADRYLYTLGPKLTPSDETGAGAFGYHVALSSDGNTALVGGSHDTNYAGAAWVFTRQGGAWVQQGGKLTPKDESPGRFGDRFGESVALSSDGKTALVGGPYDTNYAGAAWVFTRKGSSWTQQGAKLVPSDESGQGSFGYSVALSPDGNTALVGGSTDGFYRGAAWVFTRQGSTWTQQGAKLTRGHAPPRFGYFGLSVALSSDGSTAVIGSFNDWALVFTRQGGAWTRSAQLTSLEENPWFGGFGASVALSSEGNTALIGAPFDNNEGGEASRGDGSAWLFMRSGAGWSPWSP
jgi:hypothetical protein